MVRHAEHARERLDDPDDEEAVHDFRVAVRRLRSLMRAYRPYLRDTVKRKLERSLRRISRCAGASRDLQVQMDLVRASVSKRRRDAGINDLISRLEKKETRADLALRESVDEEFVDTIESLKSALDHFTSSVSESQPEMREVLTDALAQHKQELSDALGRVHGVEDRNEEHAARIAAKRLRYLLEPFAEVDRRAATSVAKLTALQDVLGNMHDAQTFASDVAVRSAKLSARNESTRGLTALGRRLHRIETAAFATVRRRWLAKPGPWVTLAFATPRK
jgi:CHAD domain-containing protein